MFLSFPKFEYIILGTIGWCIISSSVNGFFVFHCMSFSIYESKILMYFTYFLRVTFHYQTFLSEKKI